MHIGYKRAFRLALVSVSVALILTITMLFRVPLLGDKMYFHFGSAFIFTVALLMGPVYGSAVGAVGASLADMVLGALVWAPFSFLIHGCSGYLVGWIADGEGTSRDVQALVAGSLLTLLAYATSAGILYGVAAIPIQVVGDVIQVSVGSITAWFTAAAIRRCVPSIQLFRLKGD